jgi:hypothetical protein
VFAALQQVLEPSVERLLVMVHEEKERQVVLAVLEGVAEMAGKVEEHLLAKPGRLDEIMAMLKLVIMEKVLAAATSHAANNGSMGRSFEEFC